MKQFLKITILLCLPIFTVSCHLFSAKNEIDFSDFLWPDMVGVPPDKSVKSWVKLDLIGTMSHPFPFVWFSSQEFVREYPNVLIKLEEEGYEQFKLFVRANECEKNLNNVSGDPILRVTEYSDDQQQVKCIMPPAKACEYATKMFSIKKIIWTEKQRDALERMFGEFNCELVNNKYQHRGG